MGYTLAAVATSAAREAGTAVLFDSAKGRGRSAEI